MSTPLRRALSLAVGWLSDRRVPVPLRAPVYRAYARFTGARLEETRGPLDGYASLSAFFVRRLVDGARPIADGPGTLVSPCDGRVAAIVPLDAEARVRAKGADYTVAELCGDPAATGRFAGGLAVVVYLSPRDYHRVHSPRAATLERVDWLPGARYAVGVRRTARRPRTHAVNERAVLHLREPDDNPLALVMVGALNVGRIRVVGVAPGESTPTAAARALTRGAELARFELGSTVVVLVPAGRYAAAGGVEVGGGVQLGRPLLDPAPAQG